MASIERIGVVGALISVLIAVAAHAVSPAAKCAVAKLKLTGEYGLCSSTAAL